MGAVKNAYHDEICEAAWRREEAGYPDEPRDRDATPRKAAGFEAAGSQPGPERHRHD